MYPTGYIRAATAAVLLHAAVTVPHALAHVGEQATLSPLGMLFVAVVIGAGPLAALALILYRRLWTGAALLCASMLGALIFGVVSHYVIPSSDHVAHVPAGAWQLPFQLTAALLVITEALGTAVGAWGMLGHHSERSTQ